MLLTELLQQKLNLTYDQIRDMTIEEFQIFLAPRLRQLTQEQLQNNNNELVRNIRDNNLAANENGRQYEQFVAQQQEDANWGEYLEAVVLASELEFNLIFNSVRNRQSRNQIEERCTQVENAPFIQLDISSSHWEYKGKTIGNGNCLYNAFAKVIFEKVHIENQNNEKLREIDATERNSTLLPNRESYLPPEQKSKNSSKYSTLFVEKIIAHQKAIEAQISQSRKTVKSEIARPLNITKLPTKRAERLRKRQIHQDYLLALELAAEELKRASIKRRR